MPADSESELQLEIVHVLFMDVVGYSKLLLDEQREQLQALNEIVRNTAQFRASDANGMLVRIPTGDGMALIFRDSVEAPLRCAVEIGEEIKTHSEIQLRMGIHSGPVSEVRDVNERTNIAGAGIDIAQRVMDCGDAGHILLSKHVAEDLAPHPRWNRCLHDLGECEVKHGGKVSLVNFYTDEVGNPRLPEKVDRAQQQQQQQALAVARYRRPTFRRRHFLIAAGVLLVAAFATGAWFYSWHANLAVFSPEKSIAVLPLLNESGDPKDEYFSDGLSEELIAALGQIKELKVIGRSSSFRFKERTEESKTIGEKLGAATLLEGTVRRQGDRVRIVAELVNAADGIQLWTRTFDSELKDVFAVQEEIAKAVAESLKVTLLGGDARSVQGSAPSNVAAHNAYLQGHFYLVRRNVEDFRKAIGHYDQAIQLDPEYALAYAERAEAWTFLGDLTGQRPMTYPKARTDAEKAVAIAPDLAEAHAALGFVRFLVDWKFTEGLSELKRAKELSPANPTANDLLARIIVYMGRFDEAERQARHAVELDPLSTVTHGNLARVLFCAGKLDEADAAARKAAELQPTGAANHRWQVLIAAQRGDGETALREAQLEPDEGYRRFELAVAQYVAGDRQAADAALTELMAKAREGFAYQIAEVYAVRGEKDKAFEWLQVSFDDRDAGMLSLVVDPLMRSLRDDPRYKNLVARVGLPTTS